MCCCKEVDVVYVKGEFLTKFDGIKEMYVSCTKWGGGGGLFHRFVAVKGGSQVHDAF